MLIPKYIPKAKIFFLFRELPHTSEFSSHWRKIVDGSIHIAPDFNNSIILGRASTNTDHHHKLLDLVLNFLSVILGASVWPLNVLSQRAPGRCLWNSVVLAYSSSSRVHIRFSRALGDMAGAKAP